MNILKSAIAGAASAVGTHYADVAVNPTPRSPTLYYGVGAAGLLGAIWFRNSSPIAAGVLLGVGLGSAYQGYTRSSSAAGAPGMMSSLSALLAASNAVPRTRIGGLPIVRRSVGANSGGKIAIDQRAFSNTIAPYGVASFALAPAAAPGPSWAGNTTAGAPLKAPWPYGLDRDRFALPPPTSGPQAVPSVDTIKQLAQQGNDLAKQALDVLGVDTSTPQPTSYSQEQYDADTASFDADSGDF